ncbi:hypothetical protein ANRL1_02862 [Anaerolineae bacterium]|nr:hypothetical protein ANRL1_02862 [Anaerolineae bacterium]
MSDVAVLTGGKLNEDQIVGGPLDGIKVVTAISSSGKFVLAQPTRDPANCNHHGWCRSDNMALCCGDCGTPLVVERIGGKLL